MRQIHVKRQRSISIHAHRLTRRAALILMIAGGTALADSPQDNARIRTNPYVSPQVTGQNAPSLRPLELGFRPPNIPAGQQSGLTRLQTPAAQASRVQTNPHFRPTLEPIVAMPATPLRRAPNASRNILPVTDQREVVATVQETQPIFLSLSDDSRPLTNSRPLTDATPLADAKPPAGATLAPTTLAETTPVAPKNERTAEKLSPATVAQDSLAEAPPAPATEPSEPNNRAKQDNANQAPDKLASADSPVQLAPLVDFSRVPAAGSPSPGRQIAAAKNASLKRPAAQKVDNSDAETGDTEVAELVPAKRVFRLTDDSVGSGDSATVALTPPLTFDQKPSENVPDEAIVQAKPEPASAPSVSVPSMTAEPEITAQQPLIAEPKSSSAAMEPSSAARQQAVAVSTPPTPLLFIEDASSNTPTVDAVELDPVTMSAPEPSSIATPVNMALSDGSVRPRAAVAPKPDLAEFEIAENPAAGLRKLADAHTIAGVPQPPMMSEMADRNERAPVIVAPVAPGVPAMEKTDGVVSAAPFVAGPIQTPLDPEPNRTTFEVLPQLPATGSTADQLVDAVPGTVLPGKVTPHAPQSMQARSQSPAPSANATRPGLGAEPSNAQLASSIKSRPELDYRAARTKSRSVQPPSIQSPSLPTPPADRQAASQPFDQGSASSQDVVLHMERAQVKSMTIGGRLRRVSIANKDVCQAFAAGANQLKLIGTGLGRTQLTIWADVAPGEPTRVQTFTVEVADGIDAKGDRFAAHTNLLNDSIDKAFPRASVVVSRQGGQLIVTGRCDDERTATQILRMVRKSCLVPVKDQLQVR